MAVRAFRNNNPGNLEAGDHWQGLMPHDRMTPEQAAETRFAVFSASKWGFRALGVILLNYQRKHKINAVRGIIERFAPSSENDTGAYIASVARGVQHGPDDPIDLTNSNVLRALCKAIATHECGGWLFLDDDLAAGIAMAEQT